MRAGRSTAPAMQARVVVLTADPAFEDSVRSTFSASPQIALDVVVGTLSGGADGIALEGATVVVVDIDAGDAAELLALERLMLRIGNWPPVVAITQSFEENVARRLMQMRWADSWSNRCRRSSWCAPVRVSPRTKHRRPAKPPRRRFSPSCPRSAAPA